MFGSSLEHAHFNQSSHVLNEVRRRDVACRHIGVFDFAYARQSLRAPFFLFFNYNKSFNMLDNHVYPP
jgi:hypothetical protein